MDAVKTEGLVYTYPDGNQALRGVDFKAEKGEKVVILGSNGAGKSTFFYNLNGVLMPTAGKVLVFGKELGKPNLEEIRRRAGVVFQDPDDQLFAPRIWDDVAFGPRNMGLQGKDLEARVSWALKALDIYHLQDRAPHKLSEGQKKLAAIAGVLAMDSDVLVLDEPTANLDPRSGEEVLALLEELNTEYDKTVVVSSHLVDSKAKWGDKFYVMDQGRMIKSGSSREILGDEELLKRTRLKTPITVKAYRDFRVRGIASQENKYAQMPLSVLDLVDSLDDETSLRYAIADKDVVEGEEVGLTLKQGMIYAVSLSIPRATLTGRCIYSAKKGEDIAVLSLKGEIKASYGRIFILQIPSLEEGGSRAADFMKIRQLLEVEKPERLGAMGTSAKVVARKIGVECNYDVDVIQSSIAAALRSMDVAILATGKMAERAIKKIIENNRRHNREIECQYYPISPGKEGGMRTFPQERGHTRQRSIKTGIVVIGHGSRVPESRGIFEEIVRKAGETSGLKVRVGYMKHWKPTFTEAVMGLIKEGVKRVVVVPLFILPGLHVQEDIPVLLGLKEGEVPEFGYEKMKIPKDVEIIYARHIGADYRLAGVVLDRVKEVLK